MSLHDGSDDFVEMAHINDCTLADDQMSTSSSIASTYECDPPNSPHPESLKDIEIIEQGLTTDYERNLLRAIANIVPSLDPSEMNNPSEILLDLTIRALHEQRVRNKILQEERDRYVAENRAMLERSSNDAVGRECTR
eukprot:TRINITY_DN9083_c0_g1_i1.p1 TRINITY_DN9083_c0_g1~~TRINITY_DN9083_c0_g1_i1.p1  ORF type:complete len:138 (+),score=24.88 TRINITY_DN9083_c0_g1_i1:433-846(+)